MVRKIGKKDMGRVVATPKTLPLSNFRAKISKSDLKNFFMDRYLKDEATAKNLVCRKALPLPEKNWKTCWGRRPPPPPPPAIGGLTK